MWPTLRWVHADLRARRWQALLAVFVVAGVVAALVLSATLLEGATNPWRGLFARTKGAHVWIHVTAGTDLRGLAHLDGVTAVAGPYTTAAATMVRGAVKSPLELRAMAAELPLVGRPLIREGGWLARASVPGVVLETSFARTMHEGVGDRIVIVGLDGSAATMRVAGIADSSDQGFYPDATPGLAWVLPATLRRVEPVSRHTEEVVGLRLADPSAADIVVQQAVTSLGSDHVTRVSRWRDVQQSMAQNDRLLGLLLALFGLVALVAAVLAIANATGGRVMIQLQDIAMLKALGFTPGQVMRMLLLEHCAVGLAGITLGLLGARALTIPLFQRPVADSLTAVAPLPGSWVAVIAAGTELAVVLATVVPGWRAGRISPVAAVRSSPPRGRLSRLARVALLVRLPPALVLGTRDSFTRRIPAMLTIGGLAFPMVMITIGLACWSTLDNLERHPDQTGLAAALTVRSGGLDDHQVRQFVQEDRGVAASYPGAEFDALLPGETTTISTRGMGTSEHPYPFRVVAGRIFRAPGEAVAGQGLLDLLHVRVGEFVRLTIGGVPVIFHIVGRTIEPDNNGQVLSFGLDTLDQAGAVSAPQFYSLVLRAGVHPQAVSARLLAASANQLDVEQATNPADRLALVRLVIVALIAVLAMIGVSNLFTATAVGLRDHLRDVGVLRAMGLTPRQVMATGVTGTCLLALIAVITGTVAGLALSTPLIDLQARTSGVGAGIGRPPGLGTLAVTVVIALAGAAAAALVLARRAARVQFAAVLRP